MKLRIDPDATIHAIHDDALIDLYEQGDVEIARASHVEPDSTGWWFATMTDGTEFGPYRTRAEALTAEVAYLNRRMF